jgi:hypothetical protein
MPLRAALERKRLACNEPRAPSQGVIGELFRVDSREFVDRVCAGNRLIHEIT